MPAGKVNYIVIFDGSSQVYGSTSKKVALDTLPPDGLEIDSKRVLFISMEPDTDNLVVRALPKEEAYSENLIESINQEEEDKENQ